MHTDIPARFTLAKFYLKVAAQVLSLTQL